MSALQTLAHGRLVLRNRIAVAAMSRMQGSDDGMPSPEAAPYYTRYARGGAALVVTEALATDATSARAYFRQPGLWRDAHIAPWQAVARAEKNDFSKTGTANIQFHRGIVGLAGSTRLSDESERVQRSHECDSAGLAAG